MVERQLGLEAWDGREHVPTRRRTRLEQADRELRRRSRLRAVRHLGVEVRIDVAVPNPAQGRPAPLARSDTHGSDAEQRLVIEDVLAAEQTELATDEHLAPRAAHGEIDLPHVDLGAAGLIVHAGVLDLRRKAEMHAEVET